MHDDDNYNAGCDDHYADCDGVDYADDGWRMHKQDVVAAALLAFWAVVAQKHPNISTGDLGPAETAAFEDAATEAVEAWLNGNPPRRADPVDPVDFLDLF